MEMRSDLKQTDETKTSIILAKYRVNVTFLFLNMGYSQKL